MVFKLPEAKLPDFQVFIDVPLHIRLLLDGDKLVKSVARKIAYKARKQMRAGLTLSGKPIPMPKFPAKGQTRGLYRSGGMAESIGFQTGKTGIKQVAPSWRGNRAKHKELVKRNKRLKMWNNLHVGIVAVTGDNVHRKYKGLQPKMKPIDFLSVTENEFGVPDAEVKKWLDTSVRQQLRKKGGAIYIQWERSKKSALAARRMQERWLRKVNRKAVQISRSRAAAVLRRAG